MIQAETFEDLYEWKTALEQALAHAPNAALIMGQNGIFRAETNEAIEGSFHQFLFYSMLQLWPKRLTSIHNYGFIVLMHISAFIVYFQSSMRHSTFIVHNC